MRSPHLDRNWLYQKYVVEELSTYEIGRLVDRNPKNVYNKLKDFDIPTRPRSENTQRDSDRARCRQRLGEKNPFFGRKHSERTRERLSEKASVPKPYLRGANNGMSGRTGSSNPNWKGGGCPERQRLYASSEWKALMRSIYERDGFRCQRCGDPHKTGNTLHAHHIKGFTAHPDLRMEPTNLITLCNHCHRWVHSRKNTERRFLG